MNTWESFKLIPARLILSVVSKLCKRRQNEGYGARKVFNTQDMPPDCKSNNYFQSYNSDQTIQNKMLLSELSDVCYHIRETCSVVCDVISQYSLMLPDDLLDEHCVHGLFIEDRVLFHHLLNSERLRNLFNDACHYFLHYLWCRKRTSPI